MTVRGRAPLVPSMPWHAAQPTELKSLSPRLRLLCVGRIGSFGLVLHRPSHANEVLGDGIGLGIAGFAIAKERGMMAWSGVAWDS